MALGVGGCGDLLPAIELGSSSSGSSSGTTTTGAGETDLVDTGTSTGTGPDTTTGSADSSSGGTTTGEPACGNGTVDHGEICYGEPEQLANLVPLLCHIAVGDVLGSDGNPELLLAPCEGKNLRIFPGTEVGLDSGWIERNLGTSLGTDGIRAFALADFTNDGRPDVVIPSGGFQIAFFPDLAPDPPDVVLYAGVTTAEIYELIVGEFGGDTTPDLIAASISFAGALVYLGAGRDLTPLQMDPSQMLGLQQTGYEGKVADIDGDGETDLVVFNGTRIEVYPGLPGGFNLMAGQAIDIMPVHDLVIGQFDGEAGLDLLASPNGSDQLQLYANTNGVTLGSAVNLPAQPGVPRRLIPVDLNGDGLSDLVSAQDVGAERHVVISLNDGGTDFTPVLSFAITDDTGSPDPVRLLDVADLNRDGVLDIVAATSDSRILQVLSDP